MFSDGHSFATRVHILNRFPSLIRYTCQTIDPGQGERSRQALRLLQSGFGVCDLPQSSSFLRCLEAHDTVEGTIKTIYIQSIGFKQNAIHIKHYQMHERSYGMDLEMNSPLEGSLITHASNQRIFLIVDPTIYGINAHLRHRST